MKHSCKHSHRTLITYGQPPEVLQPSIGALDNPAMSVAPQLAPILMRSFAVILPRRNDRLDLTLHQQLSHSVAVVASIANQAFGVALKFRLVEVFKRRFEQFDFGRGRRLHVYSERSTRAIDQYHKLCSLAALGFADCSAPFLAGTKVPSTKHWFQRIMPCSSNWLRKARHRLSSTPLWAHWHNLRCTVLGLPYRSGNSLHGAPVHTIHKMPSKHLRSSAGGRPPCGFGSGFGNSSLIACHCFSVNCFHAIAVKSHLGLKDYLAITSVAEVLG